MKRPTPRRNAATVVVTALATFALGMTLAVFVAGSAAAASSAKPKKTTTTTKKTSATTASTSTTAPASTPTSPAGHFFVVNGTVNAASDHEIVGSSAFPNFTTGAVDNYYSMSHSHVDNSPFAEGTASPADTGPIGQTAAAGNFQQPQYADARWPGGPDTATYGSQGAPYATASAGEYRGEARAQEPSNGLSGPGPNGSHTLAVPRGFNGRLREALAQWKEKWDGPLGLKKPTLPVTVPKKPAPTVTTPVATVTLPKTGVRKPGVTTPAATVTTPVTTVATPQPNLGVTSPPPVTVPSTSLPSTTLPSASATRASRSLASLSLPPASSSSATSPDGESLLGSATVATLDPKGNALVTSGESKLGRVTLGGGQIVIQGIRVSASITNDGTPSYKVDVTVGAASIAGVPVTIDQDGVHVAGQGQGLPYQQASDALNAALKQAGIQLFLVGPEVTTNSCDQTGTGTGAGTGTTTTSSDQSSTAGSTSCDQTGASAACDQAGTGTGPPSPIAAPTTTTTSSCDQTPTCDQTATSSGSGSGAGAGPGALPGTGTGTTTTTTSSKQSRTTTTTTTTSSDQSGTTTTSSCGGTGGTTALTGSCPQAGTTTTSGDQSATAGTASPSDPMGLGSGTTNSGEEKVTATGVHVVFTQPVNQSGVPAQYAEHILGEVFVDSLAVPAGSLSNLDSSSSFSSSSSSSSACGGGPSRGTGTSGGGGLTAGGSSSAGGSASSGSLSPSGTAFGSSAQQSSGSAGTSLPAAFAAALRKPLWLLLAYVLWQALVIGTGASLWNWRRGGAS